jgi:hypothetical protein
MIFAERAGLAAGFARQRSWKQQRRIGTAQSPQGEREAFVRAKRPKRSGGAAKPLDGDGPMWPRADKDV